MNELEKRLTQKSFEKKHTRKMQFKEQGIVEQWCKMKQNKIEKAQNEFGRIENKTKNLV